MRRGHFISAIVVLLFGTVVVQAPGQPPQPTVYVVGCVQHPSGFVSDGKGLTILQALALAKGTMHNAALDSSRLIRPTTSTPNETPLHLKEILAAKAADFQLEPGDVVFIPCSRQVRTAVPQEHDGPFTYDR
jgi:protein involved in polysaccharide export with SLBB domain